MEMKELTVTVSCHDVTVVIPYCCIKESGGYNMFPEVGHEETEQDKFDLRFAAIMLLSNMPIKKLNGLLAVSLMHPEPLDDYHNDIGFSTGIEKDTVINTSTKDSGLYSDLVTSKVLSVIRSCNG